MRGGWKARPEPLVHRPEFEKKSVRVGPLGEGGGVRGRRDFGKKLKS